MKTKPRSSVMWLAASLIAASTAHAGTTNVIAVTTTSDTLDAFDQQCSLREAVRNANLNSQFSPVIGECSAGSAVLTDVIMLSGGETYNLTLAGFGDEAGDLDLLHAPSLPLDLRIAATGTDPATIRQMVAGQRVIEVHGISVELHNLVLTGGSIDGAGGGILSDAGSDLRLSRVNVFNNTANSGGGIYNAGLLDIVDSQLQLNTATFIGGGAIYNDGGDVRLRGSLVRANTGPSGGGLLIDEGDVRVIASTLNLNVANDDRGGAIQKQEGSLTIENSDFDSNSASNYGGAVSFTGIVQIRHSQFLGNTALNGGGGAIYGGSAYISHSRFTENSAQTGGAMDIARLWLRDSLLEDNAAVLFAGGGVWVGIEATVQRTRFYGNTAAVRGGGVALAGIASKSIVDSVFSGNSTQGQGGGLWLDGQVELANTTVTGNAAGNNPGQGGGGIYITSGANVSAVNISLIGNLSGGDLHKFGNLSIGNSIISTPGQPDCLMALDNPLITSLGHNIADDDSCFGLDQPGDMTQTAPMIDTFADHGGGTMTWSLLPGSPALDAGSATLCSSAPVSGLDQRGAVRPTGAACDIGAHEQNGQIDRIFANNLELY